MKRTFVLALVAALVLAPVAGLALGGTPAAASERAASANVTPGGQLASVVGAGHAEVDGAYEAQRLAAALDAADTDRERAAVLAAARDDLDARLDALDRALADLRERDVEDGEYTARLAAIVANARTAQHAAARATTAADALPTDVRSGYGVENGTFMRLRERATALVDADAEAYVSDVVGDDVGDDFETDADGEDGEDGDGTSDGDGDGTSDGDGDGTSDGDGDASDGDGSGDADGTESTEADATESTETSDSNESTETESADATETDDAIETTEDATAGDDGSDDTTDGDGGSTSDGADGTTTEGDERGSDGTGSDVIREHANRRHVASASLARAVDA